MARLRLLGVAEWPRVGVTGARCQYCAQTRSRRMQDRALMSCSHRREEDETCRVWPASTARNRGIAARWQGRRSSQKLCANSLSAFAKLCANLGENCAQFHIGRERVRAQFFEALERNRFPGRCSIFPSGKHSSEGVPQFLRHSNGAYSPEGVPQFNRKPWSVDFPLWNTFRAMWPARPHLATLSRCTAVPPTARMAGRTQPGKEPAHARDD